MIQPAMLDCRSVFFETSMAFTAQVASCVTCTAKHQLEKVVAVAGYQTMAPKHFLSGMSIQVVGRLMTYHDRL